MRRRRLLLAAALAAGALGPGCGAAPPDPARLVAELGVDGAAEALRVRIAADPADVAARRALAAIEEQRGRPGAALAELAAVHAIGGPLGDRLSGAERARLAALYRARAAARAARGSPDALDDLDRAAAIDGGAGADELRARAIVARAIADLRHTDPARRAAGAARLAPLAGDPASPLPAAIARAIADPAGASAADRGAAGLWLWREGARRAALDHLEAWERGGGRDLGGDDLAARLDAWLAARAWWRGPAGRPDLATLDRAIAAGASPCHFATAPGEHGCRPSAALAGPAEHARALLARAAAHGWRDADPAEAAPWVAITARAWQRGELASWLDAIGARVDLAAIGAPPADGGADAAPGPARLAAEIPAWARPPLLRAAGRPDEAALALERALAGGAGLAGPAALVVVLDAVAAGRDPAAIRAAVPAAAAPDVGAALAPPAAAAPAADPLRGELARARRRAPAVADRVAADHVARRVDDEVAAAEVAAAFLALGDAPRARAWAERAVEASPRDVRLRAVLVAALAAAGDGPAARQHLTTVAAGSGDAARALVDGARVLAAGGLLVDALAPAKQALELTPHGEQHEVLALLLDLAARLDRPDQARAFAAALAAQGAATPASPPPPTPASPADGSGR